MSERPSIPADGVPAVPEENSPLLHGLSGIGVSTLAGQWYCEKKVDLSFRHREAVIAAAERSLRWALGYRLGKRNPKPTRNHAKCRQCPYNTLAARMRP